MQGLECLGTHEDDEIGFDYGGLLQAAGGVAQYGISAAETAKKEQESTADQKKKLDASIAADVAASTAAAKAEASAAAKAPSAAIDLQAAQIAIAAQDRAGSAGLSAESAKKRVEAAERSLALAIKNAQAKPTDAYAKAMVSAWTATVNKANATAIVATNTSGLAGFGVAPQESFWTRPVVGPIPGYGVVIGGVGLVGALGLLVKKIFFKV